MNFSQFQSLVQAAYNSTDMEQFKQSQAGADWQQTYKDVDISEKASRILAVVWHMKDNPIKAIKQATGHTNQSLHETYGPPIRSIENWSSGSHPCAPYAAIWFAYIALSEAEII